MSAGATGAAALKTHEIHEAGWRVAEDAWLSARPELRAPSGMAICSGMEAFRLMMLKPLET